MKDSIPPQSDSDPVPGTPFDAFRDLAKRLVAVPKAEADAKEEEYQREQAEKPKRGPKEK